MSSILSTLPIAALVLLDELEVHVPRPRLAQPLHLSPHPDGLGHGIAQRVTDDRVELRDGEGGLGVLVQGTRA